CLTGILRRSTSTSPSAPRPKMSGPSTDSADQRCNASANRTEPDGFASPIGVLTPLFLNRPIFSQRLVALWGELRLVPQADVVGRTTRDNRLRSQHDKEDSGIELHDYQLSGGPG